VALRRGDAELAVVAGEWARDQYGLTVGDGPRFEMFVYADDVDGLLADLRAEGITVLRDPADMPWGERIASIADPDGNPVTLANGFPGSGLSPPPAHPPPSPGRPARPDAAGTGREVTTGRGRNLPSSTATTRSSALSTLCAAAAGSLRGRPARTRSW
jgi:hypothetical protein